MGTADGVEGSEAPEGASRMTFEACRGWGRDSTEQSNLLTIEYAE